MNARKIMLVLLIAGVAAAGAFASGDREEETETARPGWRRLPRWEGPELSEQPITVTGQVYFEKRMHPELESGGEEYELLVPRFYVYELDLREGQTVTVQGYPVEEMPCCEDEEEAELHIWVTKAVIDGVEYELEDDRPKGPGVDPRWGLGPGRGHRGGMMGRGRRM
jgi:hypothetical protein